MYTGEVRGVMAKSVGVPDTRLFGAALLPAALLAAAYAASLGVDALVRSGASSDLALLQAVAELPLVVLSPAAAGQADMITGSRRVGRAIAVGLAVLVGFTTTLWVAAGVDRLGCESVMNFGQIAGPALAVGLVAGVGSRQLPAPARGLPTGSRIGGGGRR